MDCTAGKGTGGEFEGETGGVKQQRQGLKVPAASFSFDFFDHGEGAIERRTFGAQSS